MIDLREYNKYAFASGFVGVNYMSELSASNETGRQVKDIAGIIQNLARQTYFNNLFFPDLIFKNIFWQNGTTRISIVPIYSNGKTENKLFLYVAQRLNDLNFPFRVELNNPTSQNIEVILQYTAQTRLINNTNYSKENFDKQIEQFQRSFGVSRSFWHNFLHQSKVFLFEKIAPAKILFYLPKSFSRNLIKPEGANIITPVDLLIYFKNSLPSSLKKPLLYIGGAVLIYVVVKEAARKHL